MKSNNAKTTRGILIATGVTFIVLSVIILGMSLWESFGGLKSKFHLVNLPGFHEVELKDPGLYGGIYQHRGPGPIPVKAISGLSVRLMMKQTYEEIPIVMNTTGQTFSQLGVRGMPIFNFFIHEPGIYTLSAVYLGGDPGPTIPVMLFSQVAQNIKQTLVVGALFFALFLTLGILILVKINKWAGKPNQ